MGWWAHGWRSRACHMYASPVSAAPVEAKSKLTRALYLAAYSTVDAAPMRSYSYVNSHHCHAFSATCSFRALVAEPVIAGVL
ncbi:hypothetical protein V8C35DRAFT_286698 [Trichoderma chlorosporum]